MVPRSPKHPRKNLNPHLPCHQDHKLRIYCRDRDPRTCEALRAAFRRWSERQAGWGKQQHSTPFKFKAAPRGAAGDDGCDVGGGAEQRAPKRARALTFGEGGGGQAAGGAGAGARQLAGAGAGMRLSQRSPIPE